jgi:Electron transfer DM13
MERQHAFPVEFVGELERFFATSLYPNRVPIAIGLAIAFVVAVLIARRRGWFAAARRHPGKAALVGVLALAILGPTAWYLGSPLFIRTSLVEPGPGAPPTSTANPAHTTASSSTAEPAASPGTSAGPATAGRMGTFRGADEFHFGSGTARLIETSSGSWTVRFDEFSVRNGPDLFVYLSPRPDGYAPDAVELGILKATDGSFNTDVPAGTDVAAMKSVVIWCKQFAVLFAVAPLE